MFHLPIINVKANPLDAMLYALGLRLSYLSKHKNNPAYEALVANKEVAIQFVSADGVARYYRFVDGCFGQAAGTAKHADLTIEFASSITGAKLLGKASVPDLMSAVQNGDVKINGDYKLVLWFASVAKHALELPDNYKSYLEQAKPYVQLAKPYAQKAYGLAQTLLSKVKTK